VICEGIVTTVNDDGTVNVSPMGPIVDCQITQLVLRPYKTSMTYQNLKRIAHGVFHVTDDVELLARAAVSCVGDDVQFVPVEQTGGFRLADTCRWYAFTVEKLDDSAERTRIECNVVANGRERDFFGFNRAKHAVIEAAILATRTEFLSAEYMLGEMDRLSVIVDKTAGDQEQRAFRFLSEYVREQLTRQPCSERGRESFSEQG
jgi:hypothetical protein